ncbi:serine hydrolase [Paraburkholderia bonniea]|uniref:serine hydrolase domain-containing protein n=1 Tax=Paraburkholderia bonniea TaxID=2152891 RepID=UPI002572690E|nr:serine hydrolase [Paraburkholderia bonniea]WJF89281.1 serine hydrolase [Paraburkholderia bonniea]WJF92597.1 serine hydrolase [Paraburkholderia bonniea]
MKFSKSVALAAALMSVRGTLPRRRLAASGAPGRWSGAARQPGRVSLRAQRLGLILLLVLWFAGASAVLAQPVDGVMGNQARGYQAGNQVPGYQAGNQVPGYQAGNQAQGYQAGNQVPGYQAGNQARGYQAGNQVPGYQAGNQAQGYQAGNQVPGYQAGNQARGYQAGNQVPGYQAGNQARGYQAGNQVPGYQAGDQARGYQAGNQVPGYQAGNQAQGYQAGNQAPGYQAGNQPSPGGGPGFGAEVERLLQQAVRSTPLASAAVVVLQHGQVIKRSAFGVANAELAIAANTGTAYRLDSLTKQFTAAATMVLAQRGVIDLDAPVSRYLTDAPGNWRGIRVINLMNHTAGFPHDSPGRFPPIGVQNCGDVSRSLGPLYEMRVPEGFIPGDAFHYSNAGYAVLTAVLRRATGRCYSELLDELLFRPAGMHHTSLDLLHYADPNLAIGYERGNFGLGWSRVKQLPSAMGAGDLKTTLSDMAAWERALESNTILNEQSKQRMWSRTRLNNGHFSSYGLGWFIDMSGDGMRLSHDGVGWGYNSAFYRYPRAGFAVVVLTNTKAKASEADRLAQAIALAWNPSFAMRKHRPKAAELPGLAQPVASVAIGEDRPPAPDSDGNWREPGSE